MLRFEMCRIFHHNEYLGDNIFGMLRLFRSFRWVRIRNVCSLQTILGACFYTGSAILYADLGYDEVSNWNATEVKEEYQEMGIKCFIAVGIYVLTLIFAAWQLWWSMKIEQNRIPVQRKLTRVVNGFAGRRWSDKNDTSDKQLNRPDAYELSPSYQNGTANGTTNGTTNGNANGIHVEPNAVVSNHWYLISLITSSLSCMRTGEVAPIPSFVLFDYCNPFICISNIL